MEKLNKYKLKYFTSHIDKSCGINFTPNKFINIFWSCLVWNLNYACPQIRKPLRGSIHILRTETKHVLQKNESIWHGFQFYLDNHSHCVIKSAVFGSLICGAMRDLWWEWVL